jgi:hypothetical protein
MPTPEQQREYTRLSGLLQDIGIRHRKELPRGAVSLAVTVNGGEVSVEVYDNGGKLIGTVPCDSPSLALRNDLDRAFANVILPDENVIAII